MYLLYVNVKVVIGGYLSKGKQSWACYGAALNKHNHQKNTLGCLVDITANTN